MSATSQSGLDGAMRLVSVVLLVLSLIQLSRSTDGVGYDATNDADAHAPAGTGTATDDDDTAPAPTAPPTAPPAWPTIAAKSMCPRSHPAAYRPLDGFDYCCSTCADKAGHDDWNCRTDYATRTDTCRGDVFFECLEAPCEDFVEVAVDPDDIVIDGLLRKIGIAVPPRAATHSGGGGSQSQSLHVPAMVPIVTRLDATGNIAPPPRNNPDDLPADKDADNYWYDPPPRKSPSWSPRWDPWIKADKQKLDKNMRRLNIGITISIRPDESSIFTNGAKQAAFFLRQTLMARHSVVMINLDLGTLANIGVDWNVHDVPIISWAQAQNRFFDLVVEEGMQLATSQLNHFRDKGTKCVTFRTGNDYFMTIENILFRHQPSTIFNTVGYDMIWTIPSFNASAAFQHIAFRADVIVAPYVWSPFFIDGTGILLPQRRKYLPVNRTVPGAKVISTFEPNLNVVKSSVIPMCILEAFYRRYPHLVEKAIVTNAAKMVNASDEFVHFAAGMDITKDKKIWFEGRYKFPWFMSEYGDVVLTHHWANGLNFLYIDALYNRYPLVHNSEYFKDCGYYYEEANLEQAVSALHRAVTEHDANLTQYAAAADACIYRYSVHNPTNVVGFEKLIKQVLAQPRKPVAVQGATKII